MKDITKYLVAILVAIVASLAVTAKAGEIKVHNTDPTKFIFMGDVADGDAAVLAEFLATNPTYTTMALYSPGGLVSEGIEMMALIRAYGIHTVVLDGMECDSICSFMWLGGVTRTVEGTGKIGVHQVSGPMEMILEGGARGYAEGVMQTVAWMMYRVVDAGIEVDPYWWMMTLYTPSDDMYFFDSDEIKLFIR